ncbi:PAS domain S-box-containing protein [Selenihalanaerobacter shriftii]|uniref:histidine kinase n=2 Tax=Selenihalanaerobacter shriftii TaxID=142842 RepID=A0A1T4PH91_9FIRM|nr:PAS domain S-box-containing protein [Selenihalanaerobacter shriftii]
MNKNGEVKLINRKGCEILGYSQEEIIGKNWFDNFMEEDIKDIFKSILKSTDTDDESIKFVKHHENNILTKSGETKMVAWHNAIIKDEEGNIQEILSSGLDITERKLLKEKLEYSQLKTEFFANLSHELKTPLNLIFSSLKMLNMYQNKHLDPEDNKKASKYTSIIKQNGYRLLRLVNNLVDINKINANNFNLNLKNYDIIKVIRDITESVEEYISDKDRIFEFNSELSKKIIACDPFNIERIMLNLLSNAVKFTDERDKIVVSIYDREKMVCISVKDTGVGIEKDKQEIIFERFGQADKSFTRNSEGSGIGLSIVKLLVEMHGGIITLESEPGEGSEFIIELPAKKVAEKEGKLHNQEARELFDRVSVEFSDIYD